jgi:alpha-L-fucosidase 2
LKLLTFIIVAAAVVALPAGPVATSQAAAPDAPLALWYRQPAKEWVEAIPIGNGRLAAMVFGGVEKERLQLNEDTLWAGGPYDPANPDALQALPIVRRLIADGKYREAHALVAEKMMAKPLRQMPFQPVGDLLLTFPDAGNAESYRRDLDLDTAVARVTYQSGGVTFSREVFSSPVDQVIAIRLRADRPGSITVTAGMTTPQNAAVTIEDGGTIVMRGVNAESQGIKGALKFEARVRVLAAIPKR